MEPLLSFRLRCGLVTKTSQPLKKKNDSANGPSSFRSFEVPERTAVGVSSLLPRILTSVSGHHAL